MMRYLKYCCILLLVCVNYLTAFAQATENIKKDFLTYNRLIATKDYTASLKYIPKEVFEIVPEEQMIKLMEQTMNNPDMQFEIKGTNVLTIDSVKKINNKYYSILTYIINLRMRFKDSNDKPDTANAKEKLSYIKMALQNTFGADNVKLDTITGWFDIVANKKACAISANGLNNWTFMVLESKQRLLVDKVLPKEITNTLN